VPSISRCHRCARNRDPSPAQFRQEGFVRLTGDEQRRDDLLAFPHLLKQFNLMTDHLRMNALRFVSISCFVPPIVWERPAASCSPSRVFQKANGNRSARRMRSSDYMKSSSDGSRRRPCCLPRKLPRCCSGLCWLLARSRCAKWTVGEASPRSLPIRSLTSPHEAVISSRGRSRQTQFQHKSRRHRP
jgi:hypothetical protein